MASTGQTESVVSAPSASAGLTLRQVFDQHAAFVLRTLCYLGVPDADAPDAAQEVFLVVHRRLGDFEGRSTLVTWLYGICIRVAAGHRRRARVTREELVAAAPDSGRPAPQLDDLEQREARAALLAALDELAEEQRQVFVLFEIEERAMVEVAEILGCPVRTAYSRLEAARAQVIASWQRREARGRWR